jgi:hypothetical protein
MKKIFNRPITLEDMTIKIRNIGNELIKCGIADEEPSFISQLKVLVSKQLVDNVLDKLKNYLVSQKKKNVSSCKYILFLLL